jgi:non-haem dioxygenase in morphine synthesis N-terminal
MVQYYVLNCFAHVWAVPAVMNTGVSGSVLEACFEQCRLFFAQPDDFKNAILADQNNRGYTPYQEETLDPGSQSGGDTKEGLYFGREVQPHEPDASKPLHGPNQWPDSTALPHFRPAVEAYFCACTDLGLRCAGHAMPDGHSSIPLQCIGSWAWHCRCAAAPLCTLYIQAASAHCLACSTSMPVKDHITAAVLPANGLTVQTSSCICAVIRRRSCMAQVQVPAAHALSAALALLTHNELP